VLAVVAQVQSVKTETVGLVMVGQALRHQSQARL
jgi:hypothetical protein